MSYEPVDESVDDAICTTPTGYNFRRESIAQPMEQWTGPASSYIGPFRPWEEGFQVAQQPSASTDESSSLVAGTDTFPFRLPRLVAPNSEFLDFSCFVDDQPRSGDDTVLQTSLTHNWASWTMDRSEAQYSATLTTEPGDYLGPPSGLPGPLSTEEPDILFCEYPDCDRSFTGVHRRGNLLRHQRLSHRSHSGPQDYPCQLCSKVFRRQDARLKHHRKHHPELGDNTPVPRKVPGWRQSQFPYMYPPRTAQDFALDSSQHHTALSSTDLDSNEEALISTTSLLDSAASALPYHTCPQCSLDFSTAGKLNSHISRKHDARFKCDKCDKAFNLRADLVRHERSLHTLTSSWRCTNEPCLKPGKVFTRKDNFQRHVKTCDESLQARSSANKI